MIHNPLHLSVPFDVPESISELALRPRIPRLLLRDPLLTSLRISLFLRIIGVSANGRAIFRSIDTSLLGGCSRLLLPATFAVSSGSWEDALLPRRRFDLRLLTAISTLLDVLSLSVLFLGLRRRLASPSDLAPEAGMLASRDFWRVFLTGSCSATASCVSSILELVVSGACAALALFDRERVNANPSSSSSYTIYSRLEQIPRLGRVAALPRRRQRDNLNQTIYLSSTSNLGSGRGGEGFYAPCFLFPFPTAAPPASTAFALAFVGLEPAPLDVRPPALCNTASSFSASLELVLRVLLRRSLII
jgi:hypothetical protein